MEHSEKVSQQSEDWQNVFSGQWKQMRGTLRSWWGKFTDDDWEKIAGHKDKLLGMLQEKYGYTKDMAQREMEQRFREYGSSSTSTSARSAGSAEQGNRPNRDTNGGMGQNNQETSSSLKETAADISQKAGEVYNDVKAKAQEYGSVAVEKVSEAGTAMGAKMSSIAESLRENAPQQGMVGSAAHSVADGLDAAGSYIKENTFENMAKDVTELIRRYPVQSLFVGVGIGYLFSRRTER
jgi:uncharacterized protein YjbJ (UPF0337 family)